MAYMEQIALQDRPHHAGERVDLLASVNGLDRDQDATAEQQAQPTAAPTAATSRVVCDPNLTTLIDAWPTLPEPIKAGILAIVRAADA